MLQKMLLPMESSPAFRELTWGYGAGYDNILPGLVERRGLQRYPVVAPLLAACEWYSGEIFDFSCSGFTFRIAHIRDEGGTITRKTKPNPSRQVNIYSPGSCQPLLKGLMVDTVTDLPLGPLYADNRRILLYRRSIRLATDLIEQQMDLLWPYLGDPMAMAAEWRG